MNSLIILPGECVSPREAIITGARAEYIRERHALRRGQTTRAGVMGGDRGTAIVEEEGAGRYALQLSLQERALALLPLSIVVAIPRPQTIKKVISYGTMLGVRAITFVVSDRSEKNYSKSRSLRSAEIEEQVVMALEQSGGTLSPAISVEGSLVEWIDSEHAESSRLIFADIRSSSKPMAESDPKTLILGPELGFSERELALMQEREALGISLGERILRVEVALVAAVSRL